MEDLDVVFMTAIIHWCLQNFGLSTCQTSYFQALIQLNIPNVLIVT